MEVGSEDIQTNDKGVEKLMDEYLKSNGFYRKKIAKDGSCLFRAVAEQVLRCQSRHTEVRATCVDYLKKNRAKYEMFIEGNFEEYLERLEDPQNWVGEVEISALALIYRHDFIIFQEPGKPPVNITENSFSDKVRLCFLNGNHYDSVYPTEFVNNAALCQSILYELLYEKVYGVDHSVVAPCLRSSEDDVCGECRSSEESDLEEEADFWSNNAGSSSMSNQSSSISNQPSKTTKSHHSEFSLSQRVQMSLNPSFFRNVEYDVWLKSKRAQQKRDFCIAAGMQYAVGDKCKVRLDNTGRFYSAYIQAVDLDSGPVTVFIEELGKKHSIPLWNLQPSTAEDMSWSTVAERGKKISLINGNGHHSERDSRVGRKPGRGPPTPHCPVAGAPVRVQKQHSWPPQASVEEQAAGRSAYPTARTKSELGSPNAAVQEPYFGLSPNERLAREEEQKSKALLEIMHRDERSFPALGNLAGSHAAPQATDGGKRMTAQAGERRPYRRKGDPQELSQDMDHSPRSGQRGEKNKLLNKCVGDPEQRSPSAEQKLTVQRDRSTKEASAQPDCSPSPHIAELKPLPEPSTPAALCSAPPAVSAPPPAVSTSPPAVSAPAFTVTAPVSTATAPPPAATAPPPAATAPSPIATATPSAVTAPPPGVYTPPPVVHAPVTTPSTPAAPSPHAPTPSVFAQPAPASAPALAPPPHVPSLAHPFRPPVSAAPTFPCPAVLTAPPPMAPNPPQQRDSASPAGFPSASLPAEPSPYNGANPYPPGVISHLRIAPGPPTPPVLIEHLPHPHAPSPSLPPHASMPPFHQFPQLYQDPLYPGFPVNDKDELVSLPQYSFMRNGQDLPREIGILRFFFNLGIKAYSNPMWLPHTYLYQLQQAHMNACAMQTKLLSWYTDAPSPGPMLRFSPMPPGAMAMRESYGHTTGYAQAMAGGRAPGQFEHTHCPVQPGAGVGMVGAALAPQHAELGLGLGPDGKPVLGYSPQLAGPLPPNLGGVTWAGPCPSAYPGTFSAPRPPPPTQYLPPSSPQYPPVSLGYPPPRLSYGTHVMAAVPQVSIADVPAGKYASQTPREGSPSDVPSPAPAPERVRSKEKRVATPLAEPSPPTGIPTEQAPPTEDRRTTGSGDAESEAGCARTAARVVTPQGLPVGLPVAPRPQMVKVCVREEVRSVVISQDPDDSETETGTMASGGVPIEGLTQSVTPSSEPQPYSTVYFPREVWEEDGEPGDTALQSGRSYYSRSFRGRRSYEEGRGYRENRWRGEGRGEGRGYRGQRRPEDRRDYNYRDRKAGENYSNHPGANYKGPNGRGRGRGYTQYSIDRETGYTGPYQRSNAYPQS
ncbi:hypothetical protein AAFF_G00349420 [Aldrovandia affinis]|uniref:ubiquitinyl hydrolase 1 n=1 Tax=Aldrovandia affinis TaxID=143900 RepID=A0AAD7WNI8_9TELE|nr:hypothetical protein AAFF_G00349420 [Aldrovandia affinis]